MTEFLKVKRVETNLSYSIDPSPLKDWQIQGIKSVRMKPIPWYHKLKFGPFRRIKK